MIVWPNAVLPQATNAVTVSNKEGMLCRFILFSLVNRQRADHPRCRWTGSKRFENLCNPQTVAALSVL